MWAAVSGSTCETWLSTRMQPPVAGIFSPSIQVCLVVASNVGLRIGTARLKAHPRFSRSGRTGRTVTLVLHLSSTEQAGSGAGVRGSRYSVARLSRGPDRIVCDDHFHVRRPAAGQAAGPWEVAPRGRPPTPSRA